jgi:4-hydroxythreonine-4-phosphate dehydrogenase
MRPVLLVTSGEPAGIGPELCAALAGASFPARIVVAGDKALLAERAQLVGAPVVVQDYQPGCEAPAGCLEVLHVPLDRPSVPGRLDVANAHYVIRMLDQAIDGCVSGQFAAMVTAPVQKSIINEAGIAFTGHTEYLAERTGTERVVMMLAGEYGSKTPREWLRVALLTTHLALKDVPAAITAVEVERIVRILHKDLREKFGISAPRILVAGLNPHAGEGGHMGREEIETMIPVLERLRAEGMQLMGPLPADTLFTPHQLVRGDAVLAAYHDQGLPVLKFASFGGGINVTLGLPIIRTSVDHGTALDLAGSGRADSGSLHSAIHCALNMLQAQAA